MKPHLFTSAFSNAWKAYKKGFWVFFPLGIMISTVQAGLHFSAEATQQYGLSKIITNGLFFLLMLVTLAGISIIFTVAQPYFTNQSKIRFSNIGSVPLKRSIAVTLWQLLPALILTMGLWLLIIPGIIFLVYASFSFALMLFERNTLWQSIRGSIRLVIGRFWRIFFVQLLISILPALPTLFFHSSIKSELLHPLSLLLSFLIGAIISGLFNPFCVLTWLALYNAVKTRGAVTISPDIRLFYRNLGVSAASILILSIIAFTRIVPDYVKVWLFNLLPPHQHIKLFGIILLSTLIVLVMAFIGYFLIMLLLRKVLRIKVIAWVKTLIFTLFVLLAITIVTLNITRVYKKVYTQIQANSYQICIKLYPRYHPFSPDLFNDTYQFCDAQIDIIMTGFKNCATQVYLGVVPSRQACVKQMGLKLRNALI